MVMSRGRHRKRNESLPKIALALLTLYVPAAMLTFATLNQYSRATYVSPPSIGVQADITIPTTTPDMMEPTTTEMRPTKSPLATVKDQYPPPTPTPTPIVAKTAPRKSKTTVTHVLPSVLPSVLPPALPTTTTTTTTTPPPTTTITSPLPVCSELWVRLYQAYGPIIFQNKMPCRVP